ncbi:alpha/beta fold hydrolase [Pseudomonas sp. CDFA 610]|uniref:alpha/beta fold hydrolase n=1 Tax=Pseudomonas sp. CDFA 610 TaxID=2829825 RepID=UPI001E30E210|nr:alpha/beta hydrolase [Pseudomonas sp. CDFA 610]
MPLIFVHGLGCASSSDYVRVVTSPEYPSIRSWLVDLPGSGFSDKPDCEDYGSSAQAFLLQRWICTQDTSRLALFGHSAGAFVALKLAALMPSSIERLILCAPGMNDYGVLMLQKIALMSQPEFIDTGFSRLLAHLKEAGGNDAWLGPLRMCSARAVYQWALSALEDNAAPWRETLAALPMPKSVILPDSARAADIEGFQRADCRVELIAHCRHMIAYDNPDELAAAISRSCSAGMP